MTPEQFCYWLQGFSELSGEGGAPSLEQWRMVQEHLALVFNKKTNGPVPWTNEPWPIPDGRPLNPLLPDLRPVC